MYPLRLVNSGALRFTCKAAMSQVDKNDAIGSSPSANKGSTDISIGAKGGAKKQQATASLPLIQGGPTGRSTEVHSSSSVGVSKNKGAQIIGQLQSYIAALESADYESRERIKGLKSQVDEAKREIQSLKTSKIDGAAGGYASDWSDVPPKSRAAIEDRKVMKHKLKEKKERISELERCLQARDAEVNRLKDKLSSVAHGDRKKEQTEILEQQLEEKDAKINKLEKQVNVLESSKAKNERKFKLDLSAYKRKEADLEAEVTKLSRELQVKSQEAHNANVRVKTLQKKLERRKGVGSVEVTEDSIGAVENRENNDEAVLTTSDDAGSGTFLTQGRQTEDAEWSESKVTQKLKPSNDNGSELSLDETSVSTAGNAEDANKATHDDNGSCMTKIDTSEEKVSNQPSKDESAGPNTQATNIASDRDGHDQGESYDAYQSSEGQGHANNDTEKDTTEHHEAGKKAAGSDTTPHQEDDKEEGVDEPEE